MLYIYLRKVSNFAFVVAIILLNDNSNNCFPLRTASTDVGSTVDDAFTGVITIIRVDYKVSKDM